MAHIQQIEFCKSVRDKFPEKFKNVVVLDVGSLDINGNNKYLFSEPYTYLGIDIGPGPNVNLVSKGHEFDSGEFRFDVVISTECFEHDLYWKETIENCIRLTKSDGVFLFTCASTGRPEHGTSRSLAWASPHSHVQFNDYYMNLTENDIRSIANFDKLFSEYKFEYNKEAADLYFYGIKK